MALVIGAQPPWAPEGVEWLLDRLRLWGIDEDVIAEADTRLHHDGEAGWRWLTERVSELYPPPGGPSCEYCSTRLVEPGWTGERRRVTCSGCGAVWAVDVRGSDSWGTREIEGPSVQWRADHLQVVLEDYATEELLDGDLPALPDRIELGQAHPVAKWQDSQYGAVLYMTREPIGPGELPGDEYGCDIEYCVRDQSGAWLGIDSSGGGGWVNPFSIPASLMDKYGFFGTGITGTNRVYAGVTRGGVVWPTTGSGQDWVYFTGGVVRPGIAYAEVHDNKGISRYPIDPRSRIFLVGAYGRDFSVHLLNPDESPARGPNAAPIVIALPRPETSHRAP